MKKRTTEAILLELKVYIENIQQGICRDNTTSAYYVMDLMKDKVDLVLDEVEEP